MNLTAYILIGVALIIGLIIGFIISKRLFEKQLRENPPINEEMIKAMLRQMGRPASQKHVNQIMKSMNQYK